MARIKGQLIMGYWKKLAAKLQPRTDHPLSVMLRKTMEQVEPQYVESLKADGEYEAYVTVKVDECFQDIRSLVQRGMSHSEAKELAVQDMLPVEVDEDDDDDWEEEGGQADAISGFSQWLDDNAPG